MTCMTYCSHTGMLSIGVVLPDSNIITSKFSIGVDILTVIVETKEPACTSHANITLRITIAWRWLAAWSS